MDSNPVKQPSMVHIDPVKQPSAVVEGYGVTPINKRIIFNIHPTLHKELKQRALDRNITMRAYIMKSILEQIRREKEFE